MKKIKTQIIECPPDCECNINISVNTKKESDIEDKIYNALDVAERIAVKLAQINRIINQEKKKKHKKNKKSYKIDKKTGMLILKGQKKQKNGKRLKPYKSKKEHGGKK